MPKNVMNRTKRNIKSGNVIENTLCPKDEEAYFEYFITTTTEISNLREKNNQLFFSIFKSIIIVNIVSIITFILVEQQNDNPILSSLSFTNTSTTQLLILVLLFLLCIFSMFMSYIWLNMNKTYSNINNAKFEVINEYCVNNGIYSFFQEEYKIYSKKRYSKISNYENALIVLLPILNICIFISVLVNIT